MTKKEQKEKEVLIRQKYESYKVADLAVQMFLHGVSDADIAYIMEGGESIGIKPYEKAQAWLSAAMDRVQERVPEELAVSLRQADACCLGGVRDKLAREIFNNNPTIDARFEALTKERRIIGGKAWQENGDYYICYWYDKPADGYTCACLRHVPKDAPMNRLWCECCAGHIKHHFETALGVNSVCRCVNSVLSSCGKEPCLFRLSITGEKDAVRSNTKKRK